eukprot:NODE_1474_length_1492_cov_18.947985_g1396_i0.p1 GENE.NODE_1474_length_1492_cov_18.947985_g1396_i0~~NODE_1474_length_1492_cov_18.947985_g1396_i0.p1  ORF type:complete len:385 (-),score=102.02 NODE_1474_length_1492_cov_18.947985_g1396_i0:73-1227(-)
MHLDPSNSMFPFQLGDQFFALRKWRPAAKYYEQALLLTPDHAFYWNKLGVCYAELGRNLAALRPYRMACWLEPHNPTHHFNLGVAWRGLNDPRAEDLQHSITHMQRAHELAVYTSNPNAFAEQLGMAYFQARNYHNASVYFRLALKTSPGDPGLLNMLGVTQVHLARELMEQQEERHLNIDPHTSRPLLPHFDSRLALAHLLTPAQQAYAEAAHQAPRREVFLFNLGMLHYDRQEYTAARDYFKQAVAIDGSLGNYHSQLGDTHLELGENSEAASSYERALAIGPATSGLHFQHGRALHRLERYADAAQAFERAAALEPENANIYRWWGSCVFEAGRIDQALEIFAKALAIDPYSPLRYYKLNHETYSVGEWAPPSDNNTAAFL